MAKRLKGLILTILLSSTLLLLGCRAYEYVPSPVFVPLHKEPNELVIHAGTALSSYSLQSSYSLGHIGFFVDGFFKAAGAPVEGLENWGYGNILRLNSGGIYSMNKGNFTGEGLVGFGIGKTVFSGYDEEWRFSSPTRTVFLQTNFGYQFDDGVEYGIYTRLSNQIYIDMISRVEDTAPHRVAYLNDRKKKTLVLLEPGLIVRSGGSKIKVQVQYCYTAVPNFPEVRNQSHNVYFGVFLRLNTSK